RSRRAPGDATGPSRFYNSFASPSASQPNGAARAGHNIKNKLADMGFTSASHPDLSEKVANRVSTVATDDGNDITQEAEDTIVSEVLEDLLSADINKDLPPKPASSAGIRSVPGEWRA
ncbi:hypothetical protein EIP91_008659, partial [Steccherinum ochraceum]